MQMQQQIPKRMLQRKKKSNTDKLQKKGLSH